MVFVNIAAKISVGLENKLGIPQRTPSRTLCSPHDSVLTSDASKSRLARPLLAPHRLVSRLHVPRPVSSSCRRPDHFSAASGHGAACELPATNGRRVGSLKFRRRNGERGAADSLAHPPLLSERRERVHLRQRRSVPCVPRRRNACGCARVRSGPSGDPPYATIPPIIGGTLKTREYNYLG